MAGWGDVCAEQPGLTARALGYLDAGAHKTLATIRADGAPRVSGSEVFACDGQLWFGVMPGAARVRDIRRDPRVAVHSASADPAVWTGDATVSGRAVEVTDPARIAAVMATRPQTPSGPFHLYRIDVHEVLTVCLGTPPDHLVVEVWREGRGVRRMRR